MVEAKSGQRLRIRADEWNAVRSAVRQSAGRQTGAIPGNRSLSEPGIVMVLWPSTETDVLPIGSVVGIEGIATDPGVSQHQFLLRPALKVRQYQEGDKTVVLRAPAKPGEVVEATISGASIALIDSADGSETDVGPIDSEYLLSPDGSGVSVLWVDPDPINTTENPWAESGWHWAMVLLGGGGGSIVEAPSISVQSSLVVGGDALPGSQVGIRKVTTLVEEVAAYPYLPKRAVVTAALAGSSVGSLTTVFAGQRYLTVPPVSITGGGGSGASATASLVSIGGSVEAIPVLDCGDYGGTPTIVIDAAPSGGVNATGIPLMKGRKLVGVLLTNRGRGYTVAPNVTTSGGSPTSAADLSALLTTDGVAVTLGAGGSNYTSAPTVTVGLPTNFAVGTLYGPDGIGIGTGATTPALVDVFGAQQLLINDLRSFIPFTVVSDTLDRVLITEYERTYLRLSTEDADARGCVEGYLIGGAL